MRHSQRGITLIGWLVLLVPIAIVVYAGIRLAPIYLNYMRVAKALSQTASEAKTGDATNGQTLRTAMESAATRRQLANGATRDSRFCNTDPDRRGSCVTRSHLNTLRDGRRKTTATPSRIDICARRRVSARRGQRRTILPAAA